MWSFNKYKCSFKRQYRTLPSQDKHHYFVSSYPQVCTDAKMRWFFKGMKIPENFFTYLAHFKKLVTHWLSKIPNVKFHLYSNYFTTTRIVFNPLWLCLRSLKGLISTIRKQFIVPQPDANNGGLSRPQIGPWFRFQTYGPHDHGRLVQWAHTCRHDWWFNQRPDFFRI